MYLENCEVITCDTHDTPSKRLYPFEEIKEIIQDMPLKNSLLGEMTPISFNDPLSVNLSKVTHKATNIRIIDKTVFCNINILDTPSGKALQQAIAAGMRYKFWPRATGKVDDNNVISNIKLIAIDVAVGN
jgi:hypothetical protein